MTARDYGIGATFWPGLGKLVEECGEVAQAAGKIIATNGSDAHWDGGALLHERLEDEIGDVLAAISYLTEANGLDATRIAQRARDKDQLFNRWHNQIRNGEEPS